MIGENRSGQREEQYVTERGKIVLRGEEDQIANARKMKEMTDVAKAQGDPVVFEVGGMFGPKSTLRDMDRDFNPIYEVVGFTVEKYSREKMAAVSGKFQWYTPVCVLRTGSGKLFEYKKTILLIRDPFRFPRILDQLEGHVIEGLLQGIWLDIIEGDYEFDSVIHACFSLELHVVLDPAFDSAGDFRKGVQILPMPFEESERDSLVESGDA